MRKLAIISTHPIQYNSPLFKELTERKNIKIKVFYTWGITSIGEKFDNDFGRKVEWDIPLLDGYDYQFLNNISIDKGSHSFFGIINTDLKRSINNFNPDTVLIYGWSFFSHLLTIKRFYGKYKIIFRGDSTLLDENMSSGLKIWVRRSLLKWVYASIDIAMFVGEANKAYFEKHNVKKHKLVYAPHVVDNDRFCGNGDENIRKAIVWRKELGIADDEIAFLFAGKLEPKKNPMGLLSTFMQLQNPKARLIFVGSGELEESLKEHCKEDKRVIFLGFQNQNIMPVVYRLCDVFVLPSLGPGETWGLCINEAMAAGCSCIISTKCGCAADLGGFGNQIFDPTNLGDLKKIMQLYLDDKQSIFDNQSINSQAIKNWSISQVANTIESIT